MGDSGLRSPRGNPLKDRKRLEESVLLRIVNRLAAMEALIMLGLGDFLEVLLPYLEIAKIRTSPHI